MYKTHKWFKFPELNQSKCIWWIHCCQKSDFVKLFLWLFFKYLWTVLGARRLLRRIVAFPGKKVVIQLLAGLPPFRHTVVSLLRSPWLAKPAGKIKPKSSSKMFLYKKICCFAGIKNAQNIDKFTFRHKHKWVCWIFDTKWVRLTLFKGNI